MISVYWALILAALGAMYLINPIHLSPCHDLLPLHPTSNNTVGKFGRPHQIASCCHSFPCLQSQGGSVWTWVRWGVIVLFLAMSVSLWIIDPPVDPVSPAGRPRNAKNASLEGIGTRWPPWRKRGRQGYSRTTQNWSGGVVTRGYASPGQFVPCCRQATDILHGRQWKQSKKR